MNEYKTSGEVQELLGISRTTLHRMEKEGMPFEKIGRTKRYELSTVEYWMNSRQSGIQDLIIGEVYSNDEIATIFKAGNMGGMRRSHTTNSLVIISDHTKMYDDRIEVTSEGIEVLHYTGMGKNGDQSLEFAQNKTLRDSNVNGIKVYLFEKFRDEIGYTFRGRVKLIDEPYQERQLGEDKIDRNVWMFPLQIMNKSVVVNEADLKNLQIEKKDKVEKETRNISLEELKELAKRAKNKGNRRTYTTSYTRDPYIAEYAKRRAKGICDLCEKPAQFNDKKGNPYLECHHIDFLSEGGLDTIENVVALCVVCHKKQHILRDPDERFKLINKYNPDFTTPIIEVW